MTTHADPAGLGVATAALSRREFVRRATLAVGGAALAGTALRATLARAATVVSSGPYGALSSAADANGFHLPTGFSSRVLARTGQVVPNSTYTWHSAPDGGCCFVTGDGGWVYVSNSEVSSAGGGVGVLRFDSTGAIVSAYSILTGTNRNCAGGPTVAGTWFSCEEVSSGLVYECDPLTPGQGVARPAMGTFNHEAAMEDPVTRAVYLTEDATTGRLYKFVPTTAGNFSSGQLYAAAVSGGVISWVATSSSAPDRSGSTTAFNGGEGLWIEGRRMYFTTKGDKRVWLVNLDTNAIQVLYDGVVSSTAALNAVDNVTVHRPSGDVFVCEDGGNMEICVIAERADGNIEVAPFLRIDNQASSEWAGVAFSPDHSRMYISSQRGTDGVNGITYEITGPFRRPGTIMITDDAYVRDGKSASSNYGTATTTQVQTSTSGNNRITYLKVDTSSFVGTVSSAVLRVQLKGTKGSSTPVAALAVASTAWAESTITWNNRPTVGSELARATIVGSSYSWYDFDITAHVVAERAAGRQVVSVALTAPSSSVLVTGVAAESTTTAARPRVILEH
ncbi:MAG: DUF7594 domain-containing protein [Ilumatobacteraceae bacterium]